MTTIAELCSTSTPTFDSISNIQEPTRKKFRNPQTNSIHTVQVLPESYAYYVHTKTPKDQELCSGKTKTCKFAERHLIQTQSTDFSPSESVARLVAKIIPEGESLIRSNHQAFLNLLPQLKDIPGIVQHYDQVEAVNKRGEKQFVYYQEKYTEPLLDFLNDEKPLSNAQLKEITRILLSTLHALHQKRIYHRDLKMENVLIDLNKEIPVALCDFDTAFQHGMSKNRRNQRCGTWTTRSPETTRAYLQSSTPRFEEKDLAANDVWGMGMVLHSLYTYEEFPFDLDRKKEKETKLRQRIGSLQQEDIRLKPKVTGIDDKIDPIIYSMLQTDPSTRISAEEALKQFQAL